MEDAAHLNMFWTFSNPNGVRDINDARDALKAVSTVFDIKAVKASADSVDVLAKGTREGVGATKEMTGAQLALHNTWEEGITLFPTILDNNMKWGDLNKDQLGWYREILPLAESWERKLAKLPAQLQDVVKSVLELRDKQRMMDNAVKDTAETFGFMEAGLNMLGLSFGTAGEKVKWYTSEVMAADSSMAVTGGTLFGLTVGFKLLHDGMAISAKNWEEYRRVNYRAVGSIDELRQATFQLTGELGATEDVAVQTIKSLSHAGITTSQLGAKMGMLGGSVRTGENALHSLISTNFKFSDATGVSVDTTSKLQKQMLESNMSLERQEMLLGYVAKATREYGLAADDVNMVLGSLIKMSPRLRQIYGDNAPAQMAAQLIHLAGTAKELGVEISEVNDLATSLSKNPLQHAILLRGAMSKGAAEMLYIAGHNAESLLKSIKHSGVAAGELEHKFGTTVPQLEVMIANTKKLDAEIIKSGLSAKDYLAKMGAEQAERDALNKSFASAIDTIYQKMIRLVAPFAQLAAAIGGPLLQAANLIITPFVRLAEGFGKIIGFLERIGAMAPLVFVALGSSILYAAGANSLLLGGISATIIQFAALGASAMLSAARLGLVAAAQWLVGSATLTGFVPAILAGTTALWGMVAAALALVTPFLPFIAIGAAIIAVVYGLYRGFVWFFNMILENTKIFQIIGDVFSAVWQEIKIGLMSILQPFISVGKSIIEVLQTIWHYIGGPVITVLKVVGALIFGSLALPFIVVGSLILSVFWAITKAIQIVGAVISWLAQPFIAFFKLLSWNFKESKEAILAFAYPIMWPFLKLWEIFKGIKKFIFGSSFLHIGEGLAGLFPIIKIFTMMFDSFNNIVVMIKETFVECFAIIGNAIGNIVNGVIGLLGKLVDVLMTPFKMITSIVNLAGTIAGWLFGPSESTVKISGEDLIDYQMVSGAVYAALSAWGMNPLGAVDNLTSSVITPDGMIQVGGSQTASAAPIVNVGPFNNGSGEDRVERREVAGSIKSISGLLDKMGKNPADLGKVVQLLSGILDAVSQEGAGPALMGERSNQWKIG